MENETKRKCIKCDEELTDEDLKTPEYNKEKVELLRQRLENIMSHTAITLDMKNGEVMEAIYQLMDQEEEIIRE